MKTTEQQLAAALMKLATSEIVEICDPEDEDQDEPQVWATEASTPEENIALARSYGFQEVTA